MKLVIGGTEYEAVSHQSASPLHLMELQQQSRRLVEGGLGMSRIEEIMRATAAYSTARAAWEKATAAGEDPGDLPVIPDDGLTAMAITIFLARRRAGERITFEDAIDVEGVIWIREPGDTTPDAAEEGEPDPTEPGPASPETPASAAPADDAAAE